MKGKLNIFQEQHPRTRLCRCVSCRVRESLTCCSLRKRNQGTRHGTLWNTMDRVWTSMEQYVPVHAKLLIRRGHFCSILCFSNLPAIHWDHEVMQRPTKVHIFVLLCSLVGFARELIKASMAFWQAPVPAATPANHASICINHSRGCVNLASAELIFIIVFTYNPYIPRACMFWKKMWEVHDN